MAAEKLPEGLHAMSDAQIRMLFSTIQKILAELGIIKNAVAANAEAIESLRAEDRQHWKAIDTGSFEVAEVRETLSKHEEALKKAHNSGRNKALVVTALPAIAGIVEIVRAAIANWPF
jgi:chromosome segregation ATPase